MNFRLLTKIEAKSLWKNNKGLYSLSQEVEREIFDRRVLLYVMGWAQSYGLLPEMGIDVRINKLIEIFGEYQCIEYEDGIPVYIWGLGWRDHKVMMKLGKMLVLKMGSEFPEELAVDMYTDFALAVVNEESEIGKDLRESDFLTE